MERRVSKRAESSRASQRIAYLMMSKAMDPKLWGNLPPEVAVKIYEALLIRDFYKLRMVCKEWNNVASARRCVSDPVPKPYFLLVQQGSPWGVLAYNISSGRWIWRLIAQGITFSQMPDFYEPFVVEGIMYDGFVGGSLDFLFDVQTDKNYRDFIRLPRWRIYPSPRIENSILGMMVDTSRRPHTYKLILGNCNAETLIRHSQTNEWQPKPSRMVRCRAPCPSSSPKSCVQCNGHMFIWSDSDEIQVYSLEKDQWSTLSAPPRHASDEEFRGLGHWQSELYAVTKNEQDTLSVWKLINEEWSEFDRIPSGLYSHLVQPGAVLPIVATHCNEYLLMHVQTNYNGVARMRRPKLGRRYVTFSISNKRWEIVALPYSQLWKERPS